MTGADKSHWKGDLLWSAGKKLKAHKASGHMPKVTGSHMQKVVMPHVTVSYT